MAHRGSLLECGCAGRASTRPAVVRDRSHHDMRRLFPLAIVVLVASCRPATQPATQPSTTPVSPPSTASTTSPTAATNDRLALPGGFESTVFHDGVGRARHLAVTGDGIVYVKLRGQVQGQPPAGFKGVVALRDTGGDGRADEVEYFGAYEDVGDYGTGMRVYEGYIYFTTAGEVYRQKLTPGQLVPTAPVELVLKHGYRQQVRSYEHIAKPITFDDKGHLYVPFGAPGDACQDRNRQPGAPGAMPCGQLEWHSGVWQFDARRLESDREGRQALRDRHPQPGGDDLEPDGARALRGAARPRRSLSLVAAVLLALAERDPAVGGILPRPRRLRRRLAVLLLRLDAGEEAAQPGVRRRRQEGRRRRQADPADGRLPRPLRPERSALLPGLAVPRALPPRRLHRLPRLDDPHALLAGRLHRRLRADEGRQGVGRVGSVRRRLRRHRSDPEHRRRRRPADGPGRGAGRLALHQRERQGPHLEGHLSRQARRRSARAS